MASYETGSLDFLSLFSNFMNVVEYELMYHEEIMQFHLALARLEEMTGDAVYEEAIRCSVDRRGVGRRLRLWPLVRQARRRGAQKPLYWVDPMHPWYKSDNPGIAPDCNMKLVPVYARRGGALRAPRQSPARRHACRSRPRSSN